MSVNDWEASLLSADQPIAIQNEFDRESNLHYQAQKLIGRGSFGTVFLANVLHNDQLIRNETRAIKFIRIDSMTPDQLRLAQSEARIIFHNEFTNIVKCFEFFVQDILNTSCYVIVTEYCELGDLNECLKLARSNNRPFTRIYHIDWVRQLLQIAIFLRERRIIHRDIKPGNIFLSSVRSPYNCFTIKLGDFGLARLQEHSLDLTSTNLGTILYAAPEVFGATALNPYNHKVDIWSIGCVSYEICELRYAFLPDPINHQVDLFSQVVEAVQYGPIPLLRPDHPLARVIDKMLQRRQIDRFNGDELLQLLELSVQLKA